MNTRLFTRIPVAMFTLFMTMMAEQTVVAQQVSVGADFVSRYVWRGSDFGEAASIQPALSYSTAGFEVGTWASYALDPDAAEVNELDWWVGYTIPEQAWGTVSFGATDYYFPAPDGPAFFDFGGNGSGAHWIEPFVSYTTPGKVPVTLMGAMFAHNDPDNSVYLEASIPIQVDGVELGFTVGGIAGESALYGTTGASVINLGISATKSIPVTDLFALPISVSFVLNPDSERSYLVMGISL